MLPRFNDLDPETIALVEAALPRVGKELVAMIGLSAFLSLVEQFGGQEVAFPKSATGQASALYARLVETVGHDNYQAMLFNLGHMEKFAVPMCVRAEWVLRNREIIKEYEKLLKTMSCPKAINTLVSRYRVTSRTLEKIVNGKQGNGKTCQYERDF